jgi:tetratricopeptide (TPR) repeat protein
MSEQAPMLEALVRALAEALPEVDRSRLLAAAASATAQLGDTTVSTRDVVTVDDTAEAIVDRYVERVAAAPDAAARAVLLRELADVLERDHDDADRALTARLRAFEEAPRLGELDRLQALAGWTGRWYDLDGHLETVRDGAELDPDARATIGLALAAVRAEGLADRAGALAALEQARADAPRRADVLRALAAAHAAADRPRERLDVLAALAEVTPDVAGRLALHRELVAGAEALGDRALIAEHAERVIALDPDDAPAYDLLAGLHRAAGNARALADVLARRAGRVAGVDRAAAWREIARIHEHELHDGSTALDFYRLADAAAPGDAEVLGALVRLLDERDNQVEARAAMAKLAEITSDDLERARLLRRIGEVDGAATALERAAGQPGMTVDQSALLCDAAELCAALEGQRARVIGLYRAALAAERPDARAAVALAELYWEDRAFAELVPVLRGLVGDDVAPDVRIPRLRRLAEAAEASGDTATAILALVALGPFLPGDHAIRASLAELAYAAGDWARARTAIDAVLDAREDELPSFDCAQLHYRAARCAHELGDRDAARIRVATALALDPEHKDARMLQSELTDAPDPADPRALIAHKLERAQVAPPDERAAILVAVGDLYIELGDAASARAIYSEALALRPSDHRLLTKCLEIIADQGDWAHSLDVLQRIIDTERDDSVRARYTHLAARIFRDELDATDDAAARLWQAVDTDPGLFDAADDLEALLADAEPSERAKFYYRRLEQLKTRDVREGEPARLWDRLADTCVELGKRDDAACALEVATQLEPAAVERRQRLADLYIEAGADGYDKAILQHQEILRGAKQRVASYEALLSLYMMTAQYEKARACDDALAIITPSHAPDRARVSTAEPMVLRDRPGVVSGREWSALTFSDVDRLLSALVARVAPVFVTARPNQVVEAIEHPRLRDADPRRFARVFRHVVASLGIDRPAVHVDAAQAAACRIALRANRGVLQPVVVLGAPAVDAAVDDRTLAFALARRLADLQPDRFARLLCPRPADLARIVELALAIAEADEPTGASLDNTGRWLAGHLHPVDLDQVVAIGGLLRERGVDPTAAAQAWLDGTERVADRIGVVLAGDVATCVRAVERETHTTDRVVDLVWTSVTEEAFAVRARLEGWSQSRGVITAA